MRPRAALAVSVLVMALLACGSTNRPDRDEAVAQLNEAQGFAEELLQAAAIAADGTWASEFLEEDNGCKLACADCGQANRSIEFGTSGSFEELEAALLRATEELGAEVRTARTIGDTNWYTVRGRGTGSRGHDLSLALGPETLSVYLSHVCYR